MVSCVRVYPAGRGQWRVYHMDVVEGEVMEKTNVVSWSRVRSFLMEKTNIDFLFL